MAFDPGGHGKSSGTGLTVHVQETLSYELACFLRELQAWNQLKTPGALNDTALRLKRCNESLVRAGRSEGVLIMEEFQALLATYDAADAVETSQLVRLLVEAVGLFRDRLPLMRRRSELAGLLPFLSILNECRASRGADLLSAAVVDAVGIPSPDSRQGCVDEATRSEHWMEFRSRVRENRVHIQHAILKWFGCSGYESADSQHWQNALERLREAFDATTVNETTTIEVAAWNDLLSAAGAVLDSIIMSRQNDGVAVRRLFAHLERCLAEVLGRDSYQPPLKLRQNFIWYAAESGGESESDLALRERLELDRLIAVDGEVRLLPGEVPVFVPASGLVVGSSAELAADSASAAAIRECRTAISELRNQLLDALVLGGQTRKALPDESMLRSLQCLNQSLQTLETEAPLAALAPLQKQALHRHRQSQALDAREIREFSLFIQHLEGTLAEDSAKGEEPEADEFDSSVESLREVFDEEAGHLLERMYELLEGQSAVAVPLRIAGVLAHLHTLKGSARMAGRERIAEHAHALEGEVQALDADQQLQQLQQGRLHLQKLVLDDQAERQVRTSSARLPSFVGAYSKAGTDALIETGYDEMLRSTTVIGVSFARLGDYLQRLADVAQDLESTALQWRRLQDDSDRPGSTAELELLHDLEAAREHLLGELQRASMEQRSGSRSSARIQQGLIHSRRLPAEQFRDRLQRVLDDADESRETRLPLVVEGGQTMLDRGLFRQLLPVLEHLVRNARIHGIESMSERLAAGKPAMGEVRLSVHPDGVELIVSVSDDGRGIDSIAINRAREVRGDAPLESVAALQEELCKTGFTTLSDPSPLAGRGLGLSAVRQMTEQLGGRLGLWTRQSQGTRITLTVPQPVVINASVLVRAGQRLYALPAERVISIEPLEAGAEHAEQGAESARTLNLERLLGVSAAGSEQSEATSMNFGTVMLMNHQQPLSSPRRLHVESEGVALVIQVPEVLGHRELIAQPLGQQLASLKRFSGGSVLPDGRQVLMLDLDRILQSMGTSKDSGKTEPYLQYSESTALVVDDSLTMRVAATRYLEARGVSVSTARDGVEALAMIDKRVPSVLIVDIDMPRLDGFELLNRLQLQLDGRLPPTIVISSRDRREDRLRASELGASRFLIKPWNNEALDDALVAVGVRLPDITIA